jgi:hypothetical protein
MRGITPCHEEVRPVEGDVRSLRGRRTERRGPLFAGAIRRDPREMDPAAAFELEGDQEAASRVRGEARVHAGNGRVGRSGDG